MKNRYIIVLSILILLLSINLFYVKTERFERKEDILPLLQRDFGEIEKLAQGGWSTIYKAEMDKQKIVLKVQDVDKDEYDMINTELDVLKHMPKDISYLIDNKKYKNYNVMVLKYIEGITLKQYLRENKTVNLEPIFRKIIKYVKYIHSYEIYHHDINAGNIIIDKDENVNLIDYGGGCYKHRDDILFEPPDIMENKNMSMASVDVWWLGVMLDELIKKHDINPRSLSPYLQKVLQLKNKDQIRMTLFKEL